MPSRRKHLLLLYFFIILKWCIGVKLPYLLAKMFATIVRSFDLRHVYQHLKFYSKFDTTCSTFKKYEVVSDGLTAQEKSSGAFPVRWQHVKGVARSNHQPSWYRRRLHDDAIWKSRKSVAPQQRNYVKWGWSKAKYLNSFNRGFIYSKWITLLNRTVSRQCPSTQFNL